MTTDKVWDVIIRSAGRATAWVTVEALNEAEAREIATKAAPEEAGADGAEWEVTERKSPGG
jgi:hypothetical protein